MKKIFSLVLVVCIIFAVAPVGVLAEEINLPEYFLDGESHYLLHKDYKGNITVLVDQYVISYYYNKTDGVLYYSVIEDKSLRLYSLYFIDNKDVVKTQLNIYGTATTDGFGEDTIVLMDATDKSVAEMLDAAMTIIYRNEGNYGSVNKNDNGALSIGKVQWHGNRALNLLKTIINANPSNALSLLGTTLYSEIVNSSNWTSRTVTSEEADSISSLLITSEGKAAQDALAATDITSYINHAINLGMISSMAIVYFADLENQWGYSGAGKQADKAKTTVGSYSAITLDILHNACLEYSSNYHSRRNMVYNYCLSLGWDETEDTCDYLIGDKIEQLYSLLKGKYFNVEQNKQCGTKSRGHSCPNCFTDNIIKEDWFKNMFGEVETTQQFANQYGNKNNYTRNGYSCLGFANFAEWYIFKESNEDIVSTFKVGTYNYNCSNVESYAKVGDLIRFDDTHSAIFISGDSTGMYVLDSNYMGSYNCLVEKHNISYNSYSTFTISRATNRNEISLSNDLKITSPADDSWQDPRKDIVITWNAMEGAAGYRVAVKCDSGIHEGEKPYDNVWTTDTSFTIPYGKLYHNESYKIWVGGYESQSASEALTAGHSISINTMSGPRITSPTNGYEYAHPANTTVTWTAVESASSYIIKLVNTNTGEVIYNNEDIGDTLSYTFTDLEEDTKYKFAVGTDDGWWNQGDFYFSTSKFPVISYPGNNDVCDSESITVEWSSVPGAEDYRIILKDASGNIISGYNEVSTNGKTSYTVTGLEKGETYKVNVYGVIDDGNTVQKFWGKKTVAFTIADDADDKVEEAVTLNWRDYEDGEIKEYTIDSSSAKPKRPYSFFFETNSPETPVIKISDNTVIKAVLGDNVVTVTCIGEGNASLTLSVEGKSVKLNFIVTDTAEEAETTLSWSNYEDGYIHKCSIDVENAIFERPFVLYYETNSSKAPVLAISNEDVINAEIAENCVNVTYIGAGESVLKLSVDGVSISFTFVVSDIGGEEAEIVVSGTDSNGIAWTIDVDGVLTFSGTGKMQDYAGMTESPFYNNTDIKKVVIEEGVTSIGDYVLYGCESITEISLPDSVDTIGFAAMHSCLSLENIILPEGLCEIRNNAFYGCLALKEVVIPENVKVIPKRCFMKCESLANAVLHDGITEMGEDAFRECASLKQIELSKALITVGKYCFRDCTALENIVVPSAVQTIKKGAFRGCTNLKSAEFKNTLAEVEQDMFYECSNLTKVVLPVGIQTICDAVFRGCEQLSYVYFSGEESEWLSVEVGEDNEVLASATIYYADYEKEPFEIEITEDDFEVRFDISVEEKCVVYVAEYEGETMTNAGVIPVNANETISVTAIKDEKERLMKIFVWSEDMKPYTEVIERIVK